MRLQQNNRRPSARHAHSLSQVRRSPGHHYFARRGRAVRVVPARNYTSCQRICQRVRHLHFLTTLRLRLRLTLRYVSLHEPRSDRKEDRYVIWEYDRASWRAIRSIAAAAAATTAGDNHPTEYQSFWHHTRSLADQHAVWSITAANHWKPFWPATTPAPAAAESRKQPLRREAPTGTIAQCCPGATAAAVATISPTVKKVGGFAFSK